MRPCNHINLEPKCTICRLALCNPKYSKWISEEDKNLDLSLCKEKFNQIKLPITLCIYEGEISQNAICGCMLKTIRYCEHPSEEIDRCVRGPSKDPNIKSCIDCNLKTVK